MSTRHQQAERKRKLQLLKDLVEGRDLKEVGGIFSPLVFICRDGGYLVHRDGDYTESGAPIYDHLSEAAFERIKPFFPAIVYLCERDPN